MDGSLQAAKKNQMSRSLTELDMANLDDGKKNKEDECERIAKFKTKTIWQNCDPVWNQTFTINVKAIDFLDLFTNIWVEFLVR